MLKRFSLVSLVLAVLLVVTGCGFLSKSSDDVKQDVVGQVDANDLLETAGVEGLEDVELLTMDTELEDFPDSIPLPDEFIVLVDANMGMLRQIVIEVGESNIPAMVAKFNEKILSTGIDVGLVEGTHEESGNYEAVGEFTNEEGIYYMMTVGEYGPNDNAARVGNTGVITYMIMP